MRIWLFSVPRGERARFVDLSDVEGQQLIDAGRAQCARRTSGLHLRAQEFITEDMEAAPAGEYLTRELRPRRRAKPSQ